MRIAEDQKVLNAYSSGDTKSSYQRLVLDFVIRGSEVELECIFKSKLPGAEEKHARSVAFLVGRTIHIQSPLVTIVGPLSNRS